MTAVIGFAIAATIAVAVTWLFVGRHDAPRRDPSVELSSVSIQYVAILGALSGFAITGVVLLVTLGQGLPDSSGTSFTTLLAMFFVAYLGYFAASLLYANVSRNHPNVGFDIEGASYASAAVTLNLTVVLGWLALVPLFDTFGLTRMADLAGVLLIVAILGGYWAVALQLYRSGYASPRMTVVIELIAIVATLAYAGLSGALGLRSPDSALDLTIALSILGSIAFAVQFGLPIMAGHARLGPFLAANIRFIVVAVTQASMVFVGFLLLAVLGYA
jgi:hypothetical protein